MVDFSKNRVLALYKILIKNTDEQHPISMQDILAYMESDGYICSEASILRDIKQLRNELGVDIISGRGRNARYFIGNRLLEKEEVKLIIDSVNASNFIEKSIANKMIDKLKSTMSNYDSEELTRSVLGANIAKAENKKILYNVNIIQEAMLLVTFNAVPSVILLGWLLGLNSVEVIEPQSVREAIINLLKHNMNYYTEKN